MRVLETARKITLAALFAACTGVAFVAAPAYAQTSEVRYVVNDVPITSYDIQRRAAFLRLQQRGGGTQAAADELIEQTLRNLELQRLNIDVPEQQVDDSYARFAQSNDLSVQQLNEILAQSGVTRTHFRDYIRAQMGWGQALQARARAETESNETDVVQRMLQDGGDRPSSTEYMLQQVIFVVPEAERGARLGARVREAEAMRQRFSGCETTREFARGLVDVTVRDLGRVLEPELPADWADSVTSIGEGQATRVRETERGAEFIGICSAREVSDDRVAEMLMRSEEGSESQEELSEKYTEELREQARIITR